VLALLAKMPCKSLLEIGCGAGALLVDLSHAGFHCVGMETSSLTLGMAADISNASGVSHDILSCPDDSWGEAFDTVCTFDVLEQIKGDVAALSN